MMKYRTGHIEKGTMSLSEHLNDRLKPLIEINKMSLER